MELRPVQELAGLLCYADPIEQTKGSEVARFLSEETARALVDAIITAVASADMHGQKKTGAPPTLLLGRMLQQLQVTQDFLVAARQN